MLGDGTLHMRRTAAVLGVAAVATLAIGVPAALSERAGTGAAAGLAGAAAVPARPAAPAWASASLVPAQLPDGSTLDRAETTELPASAGVAAVRVRSQRAQLPHDQGTLIVQVASGGDGSLSAGPGLRPRIEVVGGNERVRFRDREDEFLRWRLDPATVVSLSSRGDVTGKVLRAAAASLAPALQPTGPVAPQDLRWTESVEVFDPGEGSDPG